MFVFAKRMLRDKFKSFLIYSVASIAFIEMFVAIFPSIKDQAAKVDQLMKVFPPALFKAFNMDISSMSFGNFETFLSSKYLGMMWPVLLIIFAISLANYIVVNEIEKGTIETLMSLPAKRSKIFLQRYFAGLGLLAGFCIIGIFGAIPLAMLHGVDFAIANYFTAAIVAFLFAWAIYSLAIFFSTIFSEKGKASMMSGGILVVMYVLSVVAALNDNLVNLKYFSFFHYFNGSELLAKNVIPDYAVLALGGFGLVALIVSLIIFKRRDLSV